MSEHGSVKGGTIVISGASSGIGRAVATAVAGAGGRLYLTGRRDDALRETAGACEAAGAVVVAEAFDVVDAARLAAFVTRARAETGRLDVLVNAAGVMRPGPIGGGDPAGWREMFEVNVLAALAATRAAIDAMLDGDGRGHIVNFGSVSVGAETGGVYGMTKAAIDYLGRTLRHELAESSIRVVTVTPGNTATNAGRHFPPGELERLLAAAGVAPPADGAPLDDAALTRVRDAFPLALLDPADVARAVVFAITQPPHVDLSEITVRPQRPLH